MSARDLRTRIAGLALLVMLGAGLLTRITDHRESPSKNPVQWSVEIPLLLEGQPVTETVDLRNGNLHVDSVWITGALFKHPTPRHS